MIKKSVITALVLMGVYHLLLPHLPHRFYQILGQQRSNYLRAQNYVFDVPDQTSVIVGSSMSERLNDQMLGPNYYKLTMPGGSLFTSLEIIQRARKRPPVVLIETNVVNRDADQELLHDLFSPVLFRLRSFSRIFKEEGRPANFVGGVAEASVRKSCEWTARVLGRDKAEPAAGSGDLPDALRSKLIRAEQKNWNTKPSQELLAKEMTKLGEYVDALNQQGSICILFEMPVDSALATLDGPSMVRQALYDRFPKDRYRWIPLENDGSYRTRDGIHLIPAEADKLTQVIIDYLATVTPPTRQAEIVRQTNIVPH